MLPNRGRLLPALLAGAALAALVPAVAQADSITYLRGGDVWVAAPDGSAARQVTTGGGYASPSRADDGTIAAAKGDRIQLLDRFGAVLRTLDPPGVADKRGVTLDGPVADIAISPDGKRIAFAYRAADDGDPCMSFDHCIAGGVIPSTGGTVTDTSLREEPSWISDGRLLLFAPTEQKTNYKDLGAAETHWFEDWDVWPGYGAGNTDGEVNRRGDLVALLRGGGDTVKVQIYRVSGNAIRGEPGFPSRFCETAYDAKHNSPSFSPDGTGLVWGTAAGLTVAAGLSPDADCDQIVAADILPGASEPDWGPAAVGTPTPPPPPPPGLKPAPKPAPQQPGPAVIPSPAGQAVTIGGRPRVKGGKVKVQVTLAQPAGFEAVLRLRGKAIARKQGLGASAAVTIRLPARHARAVRKLPKRSGALTVVVTAGKAAQTVVVAPR